MDKSSAWKIALIVGILLSLVAFILGWIGFGVPDWHSFQRFNGSTKEFYGLWAYCQEQTGIYGTVCKRWPTAEAQLFNGSRPNFIRTSQGLITSGMILLSLGLFSAIVALLLPVLSFLAALLALLAFILLVIGLPIFGRQSNDLSQFRGDATYGKRYGFWLIVPTIVLEFLSIIFFLIAGILYRKSGYGNLTTNFRKNNYPPVPIGGRQMLGQPIRFAQPVVAPSYGSMIPPMSLPPMLPPSPLYSPVTQRSILPGLLSEYLTQVNTQSSNPLILPPIAVSAPSQTIPLASYLRAEEPAGPLFQPIINMTGRTIIGPIRQVT